MGSFVKLGKFAHGPPEDAREIAAQLKQEAPNATLVACNVIMPGSRVVASHIETVPRSPGHDYIALFAGDPGALSEDTGCDLWPVEQWSTNPCDLGRGNVPEKDIAIRQICLIKKRKDLSFQAFQDYYEGNHAPLAADALRTIARYSRYYALPSDSDDHSSHNAHRLDFDVITEICFAGDQDYDIFLRSFADPKIGDMFARDEEQLFDRAAISMFLVRKIEFPTEER